MDDPAKGQLKNLTKQLNETNDEFGNITQSKESLIIVPNNEILDFDSNFEEEMGVYNLDLDNEREAYININENSLYVPILSGYILENEISSDNPKIKEVGAGIKFKIARKNPRSNPNKCQGGCQCGIGLNCGSTKYVYVDFGVKSESENVFDIENREAIARQLIDTVGNYYIFKFITTKINWKELNDE